MQSILSLPQNVDRNQKIFAMNGKEFYLVDIIAHIFHHLKCRVLKELRNFGYKQLRATDIHWVITIPVIWKSRGRKMMREAGYMVSPNSIYLLTYQNFAVGGAQAKLHRRAGKHCFSVLNWLTNVFNLTLIPAI